MVAYSYVSGSCCVRESRLAMSEESPGGSFQPTYVLYVPVMYQVLSNESKDMT
jgi:hypothetical protein